MNVVNLISAKALQSKRDNRMATLLSIEGDNAILDIQQVGRRVFPVQLVLDGFEIHLDNKSLVKGFLKNQHVSECTPASDAECDYLAQQVWDIMQRRFKDLSHVDTYRAVREYLMEKN